jgi:hypothetical protein
MEANFCMQGTLVSGAWYSKSRNMKGQVVGTVAWVLLRARYVLWAENSRQG